MATIALHTAPDGLLSAIAPLGCAAAVGTALAIDLDPHGLPLPGRRTLRDLVEEGPTAMELTPARSGTASLPNGGVSATDAALVVGALLRSWPNVVLRLASESDAPSDVLGVAVRPLIRGVAASETFPTLFQPIGLDEGVNGAQGARLPRLPAHTARALFAGRTARGAWIRAWGMVWARA